MIINNITPNIKSLTLLKKYISIQLFTQLKLLMYSSGLSILKLGFAPAFDHNSYQLFIKFTSDIGMPQLISLKHVKLNG